MNTAIQIFKNSQFGEVRVVEVNGEPVFCLPDLCNVLGLSNTSVVKNRLDDDLSLTYPISDSLGRTQEATFVTESGMYDVIIRSDSPKAKPFRKWVTSEVLPTIRKHGGYLTPQKTEDLLMNPDLIIKMATSLKEERQKREIAEKNAYELHKTNETLKPKALFADAVATSDSSILVSELAKILKQNGIEMGQNRLFIWLRKHGYLCSKGEYYNHPSQKAMECGLFELKKTSISKPDGSVFVTCTTKVTGKGQIYFVNKFIQTDAIN
jgi:prophage antirepressor-like protein